MNSLYPILRKVLVQVTKIATTVLLLIVLIDYFEKLIAFKFESVYEGILLSLYSYIIYHCRVYSNLIHYFSILAHS